MYGSPMDIFNIEHLAWQKIGLVISLAKNLTEKSPIEVRNYIKDMSDMSNLTHRSFCLRC